MANSVKRSVKKMSHKHKSPKHKSPKHKSPSKSPSKATTVAKVKKSKTARLKKLLRKLFKRSAKSMTGVSSQN